jgi:hypothetical protein
VNEFRSEIRASFEREQASHPPPPSLRQTVVEAAISQPRRETNHQWLVVAAAALLGIVVVTGLITSRHITLVADYGPPPGGVSLIYVADPNHKGWYIGFDWSGKPRSTVKVAQNLDKFQRVFQSPDGSAFLITDRRDVHGGDGFSERLGAPTGNYLDRLGNILPGSSPGIAARGVWADDSRHFCFLYFDVQSDYPLLAIAIPGQAPRTVTTVPSHGPWILTTSFHVASCSLKNDRAIVAMNFGPRTRSLWVVRLSDGMVLGDHSPPAEVGSMVASTDCEYVAENLGNGGQVTSVQVRRVSDWTVIASLPTQLGVIAFGADSSTVVFSSWGRLDGVDVVDWRTGKVIWRHTGPEVLVGLLPEPNGRGIAVALAAPLKVGPSPCSNLPPPTTCTPNLFYSQVYAVTIVHADGSTTQIQARYATAW